MKAYLLEKKNETPALSETDTPRAYREELRIRVRAAALNHRDVYIMQGLYAGVEYPVIPCSDGAGVVDQVGDEANAHWIGQEVIINPSMNWGDDPAAQGREYRILGMPDPGTLAEYVKVPAGQVFAKPAHLSFEQAAALPLTGLTAYRAMFTRGRLQSGERVLITGIGGGVALAALSFAVAMEAEVWVTSGSPDKIERACSLGAKGGAIYKEEGWVKDIKKRAGAFDLIIDGAGGKGFAGLLDLAAPGARIVQYGGTAGNMDGVSPQRFFWKQLNLMGSTMGDETDFRNMLNFVNRYGIVPVIDDVFDFDNAPEAFDKMKKGSQFGKLVVAVPVAE